MAKYEKPMVIANDELAEGVFAASGCYTVNAYAHQEENNKKQYRIQVDGVHNATHTCEEQTFTINFNVAVTLVSCQGQLVSPADGKPSSQLVVKYNYHNNKTDNIGLGDFVVSTTGSEPLTIVGCSLTDDVE